LHQVFTPSANKATYSNCNDPGLEIRQGIRLNTLNAALPFVFKLLGASVQYHGFIQCMFYNICIELVLIASYVKELKKGAKLLPEII
jgi:hypothetical protein